MPTTVLDATGLMCPLPVLKAKKAIARLSPGDVLEVISSDPGSVADFTVFCAALGHTLLAQSADAGVYRYRIQRG